ncbi:MAG: acyltransferase [Bacteroidetes bacterium]|nr:acyltransferase [Bacteroidota bacterium]
MEQTAVADIKTTEPVKDAAPVKVYFHNLNALRFLAASMVMVTHIEKLKEINNLPNHYNNTNALFLLAKMGVNLFFALSGFLITSLLLIEQKKYGRISIKDFYMRRVLRIWPVYFLVIFLAFFILPHFPIFTIKGWSDPTGSNFAINLALFIFFLPNLQLLLFGPLPYLVQTWSIGVEEQYYLFWPLIVNKLRDATKIKKGILVLIAVYVAIKIFLILAGSRFPNKFLIGALTFFKNDFQIDCLLIGSYFACVNYLGEMKQLLLNKYTQLFCYVASAGIIIANLAFKNFVWEIEAVLFSIIILNLVNHKTSIINLDYKPLNYIGKVSYGMYMYHFIVVNMVIRLISNNSIVIYLMGFICTIGMAALSYELFEKKLLKLKERFARIKTGPAK